MCFAEKKNLGFIFAIQILLQIILTVEKLYTKILQ